jgi:hypothetical protein
MNPEDLARRRWRPVEKAVAKRDRLGKELSETNQSLAALRSELSQAERADRDAYAAALADGDKAEPPRKAMQLAAAVAAEERRSEALQAATANAESEIYQLREQNRSAWSRDTIGAITKAHRAYTEAVRAVGAARDVLADEVALVSWIRGGTGASPVTDTLPPEGLSFTRVLRMLHEDAKRVATHLPEVEPRPSWQQVKARAEALITQGLSREEALGQAGGPEWGGE